MSSVRLKYKPYFVCSVLLVVCNRTMICSVRKGDRRGKGESKGECI